MKKVWSQGSDGSVFKNDHMSNIHKPHHIHISTSSVQRDCPYRVGVFSNASAFSKVQYKLCTSCSDVYVDVHGLWMLDIMVILKHTHLPCPHTFFTSSSLHFL